MRNEPLDISAFGRLPLNKAAWATVLDGRARRVYAFGGPVPSGRFLPNALGLEPVNMQAYRYDAAGALTQLDDYERIAAQLAAEEGWLAHDWAPPCAEMFMREADAIVWLDDELAAVAKSMDRYGRGESDVLWALVCGVRRVMRWQRRRSGHERRRGARPLALALNRPTGDPALALAWMAVSEFPTKVLRVTRNGQIAALNAVRPTR